ncbi:hypothetical protein SCUCBS95973_006862 [Sporothrix curviconia]|uniref:FHA domain-containing protein n=1 Tax=Sporothrix curviconia TaxID=1260050 RepID=A0ABP0CB60_9PEZI
MGSDGSDREAPRRRRTDEKRDEKRDGERHRDRRRDRRDEDRGDRRSDKRGDDNYERRSRGDDRDDRDRHGRHGRDRRDHDRRRSRSRSPDSRKRQRRDDSQERDHSARRERRRHSRDGRDGRDGRDDPADRDDNDDRRRQRRKDDAIGGGGGSSSGEGKEKRAIQSARQSGPLPDQEASFAMAEGGEPPKPPKEQPNWGTTGALAAASNAVAQADGSSITLKYHEPPEARKPSPRDQWKLFVFKEGAIIDTIDLGARSCWLAGRDEAVVDLLAAHPSISKQHAVLQFRYVEKRNEFGDRIGRVKPYLLDLASANGTKLNHDEVATQRYVELQDKDLVQFGHSAREYVLVLAPRA